MPDDDAPGPEAPLVTRPTHVKVAVVQPAGSPFEAGAAVDKVCRMTAEAGAEGARLVLFPEAFVGGYPWGLGFGTAVGSRTEPGRRLWERYWSAAIDVPGPEVARTIR